MRFVVAFLTLIILHPIIALANSDAVELERVGLLGHWAEDCNRPSSDNNQHYMTEALEDGSVVDSGYMENETPIIVTNEHFVRRLENNLVEMRSSYRQPGIYESVDVVVAVESNRRRTMKAVTISGKNLVLDGKGVEDGQPTPWYYRCGPPTS